MSHEEMSYSPSTRHYLKGSEERISFLRSTHQGMLSSFISSTGLAIFLLTELVTVNAVGWGTYDPAYDLHFQRRRPKNKSMSSGSSATQSRGTVPRPVSPIRFP